MGDLVTRGSTELTPFEQRMMDDAAEAAAEEKGGYPVLRLEKSKKFSIDGENLGETIEAVILAASFENSYYAKRYDPTDPQPPDCFAIGYKESELAPPADLKTKVSEKCDGCPKNAWGSSNTGDGKACKNQRKIAFMAPDQVGAAHPTIVIGHMPPTTGKNLAKYIKKLNDLFHKPIYAVITKLGFDQKSEWQKITFEKVADLDMESSAPAAMAAADGIKPELIKTFVFNKDAEDQTAAAAPAETTGKKKPKF